MAKGSPMSTDPESSKSSNTTLIIVLVVAVVLVVLIGMCGGLVYLGTRVISQISQVSSSAMQMMQDIGMAQTTADDFLADIKDGRLDGAYERTTESFRKGKSLEEFQKWIDHNPALRSYTSRAGSPTTVTPGLVTLQTTLAGENGTVQCTVRVVKEGEKWKVDQFTIP
jgi:hypothetical protein